MAHAQTKAITTKIAVESRIATINATRQRRMRHTQRSTRRRLLASHACRFTGAGFTCPGTKAQPSPTPASFPPPRQARAWPPVGRTVPAAVCITAL
jgi:hypothetical protein